MSNEFLNGLQAASNAVAGNVAGPVDILAFLLRKAGMPVSENAIGGSNWMTQKGLIAPVRQGASQVIGETAGLLGPAMVSQFGPQIARGLLSAGDNLAAPRTLNPQTGAIVYHGSPHKFDKFDSSKIGTGEGAQAYGYGLYLSGTPGVAAQYQKNLSSRVKSANVGADVPVGDARGIAHEIATVHGGNVEEFIKSNRLHYSLEESRAYAIGNSNRAKVLREIADENEAIARQFLGKPVTAGPEGGALYKVDLPDEKIARMLDWDKPLSEQAPEVRAALAHKPATRSGPEYSADELINAMIEGKTLPTRQTVTQDQISPLSQALGMFREKSASTKPPTGEQLYRALSEQYGHDKAAAMMKEAGIPGIRYLDGGSRGAGTGTRNYVVFPGEEGILKILERNGQGLLGP